MNYCKICGKEISDKYKKCYSCLEKEKQEAKSHLDPFTCSNCKQTMYSMKWEGNLCGSCYSSKKAIEFDKNGNLNPQILNYKIKHEETEEIIDEYFENNCDFQIEYDKKGIPKLKKRSEKK